GLGDDTADACAAVAPGHCPAIAVPKRTVDQVVPVAQGQDGEVESTTSGANHIIWVVADEAIGVGDIAADPCATIAPGHRTAIAVPERTLDHVVPVFQGDDG